MDRSTCMPVNRTVIDEEKKPHARYPAGMRTEDGTSTTDVFVNFAANYNITARCLLAGHNPSLARTLHPCTRVTGDMFIVPMEYLPGAPFLDVWLPLPASVYEAIGWASPGLSGYFTNMNSFSVTSGRRIGCTCRRAVLGPYLLILVVLVEMERSGTPPVLTLMGGFGG